jgi:hypothetical protein
LYALVCYAAFAVVQQKLPPRFVSWKSLIEQLGADCSDPKNFKKQAQAAVRKIVGLFPGLTIKQAKGGFLFHATRLAVAAVGCKTP